jgi:TubC N-terminal docking domain
MTASLILLDLHSKGIEVSLRGDKLRLEPKDALTPDVLATVKEHKASLMAHLSVPRLPWQLERLVTAPASGVLNVYLAGVPDPSRYVTAWALTYFTSNQRDEALKRLWEVYNLWQNQRINCL